MNTCKAEREATAPNNIESKIMHAEVLGFSIICILLRAVTSKYFNLFN